MQPAPSNTVPLKATIRSAPLAWTPSRYQAIGVVIIAHDREHEIDDCVRGVFATYKLLGWSKPLWIVIVADACGDRTARAGRAATHAFGEVLSITARSEVKACAIGTEAILNHFHRMSRGRILLWHICAGCQASELFLSHVRHIGASDPLIC